MEFGVKTDSTIVHHINNYKDEIENSEGVYDAKGIHKRRVSRKDNSEVQAESNESAMKKKEESERLTTFGMKFTNVIDLEKNNVTQILNKRNVLSKQESVYNYRTIFRFFDAVVSASPSCAFIPGETRLQAINNELERLKMSTKSYYNADGVILDNDTGFELCLLETSDPFGLIDISRETKDQVKVAYDLLSVLHTIAHQFVHADIQVFKKLNTCFVPAAQNIDNAVLPTSNSDQFRAEFMHLVNLFWKLEMLLDDAKSSLSEIEASHTKNETAYFDGHIKDLPRLDHYLVESAEVKFSSRISKVSDIYISRSPIQPDSP
ncbi:MAG: hypothetical protein EXX96DRAFT_622852 [Benjaminiella poitrasii]|nr:MAG: hypothetical protein EXX96DRAFT_622852 [Benjaminiella poitrasii]